MKETIYNLTIENKRNQAIEEGELIDLSSRFPEETAPNYRCPVYCSAAVWERVSLGAQISGDLDVTVWDLVYMSRSPDLANQNPFCYSFSVAIPFPYFRHRFKTVFAMGDRSEDDAMIFIVMPEEE